VVFLHGTTLGHALVLENWKHVRPRDFSRLDADKLSRARLMQAVGSDPSARNLLFLALNFGHEVWIPSRRGFAGSRQRVQDRNRTLADAIRAVPDSLLGFKYVGGLSSSGGLTAGRPRRKASSVGRSGKRAGPFDANAWLAGEMLRLLNESSSLEDRARALLAPLPLVSMPESLMLFTDPGFQRDFIDTFNPDFWSFSLDEQAEFDLPAVVEFVLATTGKRRVHLVGLSCGGAIILLGLAAQPGLADKGEFIRSGARAVAQYQPTNPNPVAPFRPFVTGRRPVGAAVLWAPSVSLGSGSDIVYQLSQLVPIFQTIVGPFPALFLNKPLQEVLHTLCTSSADNMDTCRLIYDSVFGYSGAQARLVSSEREHASHT
jgi:pimeloyl-ACP methyl ester carboxylesterase